MDWHSAVSQAAVWGPLSTVLLLMVASMGMLMYTRRDRNLPPGPLFVPLGFFFRGLVGPLNDLQDKYGPVASFRVGRKLVVVLSESSAVREALVDQADIFVDRCHTRSQSLQDDGFRGSILFSNGPEWKELRRITSSAMRRFGVGKRSFVTNINSETEPLLDAIAEQKGVPFDPAYAIGNAVANITCNFIFGRRFEYTDRTFRELLSALRLYSRRGVHGMFRNIFPYAGYLPHHRKETESFRFVRSFVKETIKEHRATLDPNDVRDLIDVFLLEADKQEEGADDVHPRMDTIWKTIRDLFGAGSDTTTNTLLWAIAIFCHHPSVQEKVHKEVTGLIGVDRLPSYEDRDHLPYTEAVLLEVQRFRTVIPVSPNRATGDAVVGGYHIPKGTRVVINYWAVHHSQEDWGTPEFFHPERFLDKSGGVIRYTYHFPFGLGRRLCLGDSLAKMEMFLFLTSLVQRFRFYTPEGSRLPSLDGIQGISLAPKPFDVCAEARI